MQVKPPTESFHLRVQGLIGVEGWEVMADAVKLQPGYELLFPPSTFCCQHQTKWRMYQTKDWVHSSSCNPAGLTCHSSCSAAVASFCGWTSSPLDFSAKLRRWNLHNAVAADAGLASFCICSAELVFFVAVCYRRLCCSCLVLPPTNCNFCVRMCLWQTWFSFSFSGWLDLTIRGSQANSCASHLFCWKSANCSRLVEEAACCILLVSPAFSSVKLLYVIGYMWFGGLSSPYLSGRPETTTWENRPVKVKLAAVWLKRLQPSGLFPSSCVLRSSASQPLSLRLFKIGFANSQVFLLK